jgi:nucleoside-diphosphate-sugar epimerase
MNIDSTQALLEACLRRKDSLQRFVFASSSSVYGDVGALPANEHDLPRPVSPYGVTKLAAEQLCTLYGRNFGLPTVSLRYFTVYGPGQRPDMAFSRFIDSAIRGEPITVFGSGEQVRDCTYIEDVVLANMLAGIRPVSPGTVLNVSGGSDVSINAVLGLVEELAQRPISVINEEAVAGDAQRTAGDTRAIRELLGWRPTVELREGLSRQISSMTVCHARDGG